MPTRHGYCDCKMPITSRGLAWMTSEVPSQICNPVMFENHPVCFSFRQGMLSPVPELRDSSKLQDSSYIDDCTFQQLSTFVHAVRDPVHNRVTLVSVGPWTEQPPSFCHACTWHSWPGSGAFSELIYGIVPRLLTLPSLKTTGVTFSWNDDKTEDSGSSAGRSMLCLW